MSTRILCPECSAALRLSEALLGKAVKCPKCALTFTASANQAMSSAGTPPRRSTRRRDEEENEDQDANRDQPASRAGLWIGLLSTICVGLLVIVGYLLFSRNRDNPIPTPVVQAPLVPNLIPQPEPNPLPQPPNGNDFANRFGGAPPAPVPAEGERVKLSNPRYQRDDFGPFEKLCVDYQFNDGNRFGPRIGLVMILKSGNQQSEAMLFGLLNDSGTIALDSFGLRKVPAGTEMWIAEGFGGMDRFGPQPKRISNVVVAP
jgi:predicted Zn finger-like uncharacterized protein